MGTWGVENFARDGALDYLGDVVRYLVENITVFLARAAPDLAEGEEVVMPSAQMILTLCTAHRAALPRPSEVEDWRARYLVLFDEQSHATAPPSYKPERRAVIDKTFADLHALATTYWSR
jgi:hypothetical protein